MSAAVLLPALFVVVGAERLLFAVAHGHHAVGRDAKRYEELLRGLGTAIAERQVVFGGTTLVAMAFNRDFDLRIGTQKLTRLGESVARIATTANGANRIASAKTSNTKLP